MELLRLITGGSVDDGKSTLIGRLLYDTKTLLQDQVRSLEHSSRKKGLSHLDFSLVTDGLKDEREQGITIDVAYRYFTTSGRKYILADTPGHFQYTRNFVTAASNANLAVLLIDARKGVTEQTRRHALISSIMGIKHLVFCINKMDLVEYDEAIFDRIKNDIEILSAKLEIYDVRYIPLSALHGENIVDRSANMPWYTGWTLLETLDNIHISSDRNLIDGRFPVQTTIRTNTDAFPDHRAYAGQIASGIFKTGDEVVVLPAGHSTVISKIFTPKGEVMQAEPPASVSLVLQNDIDVSRGDMIVKKNNQPALSANIEVLLCWLGDIPMREGDTFILRTVAQEASARVQQIQYKIDVDNFSRSECIDGIVQQNEISRMTLQLNKVLAFDLYKLNRITGAFILIDSKNNNTVSAGTVIHINM
jgi:sulfate adenylyltransferase subunit 1